MIASSNCETSRDFSDKFPWQCLIFCFNLEQTFLKCFNVKVEFCNNEANLCKPSSTSMGRDWEQAKHKSSWAFLLFSSSKTMKFVFFYTLCKNSYFFINNEQSENRYKTVKNRPICIKLTVWKLQEFTILKKSKYFEYGQFLPWKISRKI